MWKKISEEKPKIRGFVKCFGLLWEGTDFEEKARFNAFYDGERFVDKDGEDLTGINDSVEYWFDFDEIENP